ncbi:HAMP domain-containing histidine kinase [Wenzhouxiangella sp. XN79A]|uniref:sensor histidine kinase n=1 Tax=Wenzhouxiangella sp. XN79A TaxID=2724193 RepID=UPI00144AC6B1|nr:HAMP domain-containing sensor histidine kinase [Wenzhouxiangella sp. XN79A]NKI35036.1 HAMP domain-containing histidine kinase [Wenzhouxiangella sp. XN79A]
MNYRHRLKSRIITSFVLFGTLLSVLFAAAVLLMQSQLEDALIARTLEQELDQYLTEFREDPSLVEPFYSRIQGYVTRPGRAEIVPGAFRDLPTGVHDVRDEGQVYKAAVRKDPDVWAFLTYDVSENRELARRLLWALGGAVVLFSLLSLALGMWSAGRVMAPVSNLARRLEALEGTEGALDLARHFPDDEVGQLAAVVDEYALKLHDLVERDKAFNADVSHELRTPLAVISGATELLLGQPDLPERTRQRLLRIARAARQSTDITTALLHLVRAERGSGDEATKQDVGEVADQLVENYRPLIEGRPVELEAVHETRLSVIAPEAVLAVVLGNLLGNALRYTHEGRVEIRVAAGLVRIVDTGPGIPDEELPHVFDRHFRGSGAGGKGSGLGLSIVKRLCDLYDWTIEFRNREDRSGLIVEVAFYPDLDAMERDAEDPAGRV